MRPIMKIGALVLALLLTVAGMGLIVTAADDVVKMGQLNGYEIQVTAALPAKHHLG